MAQAVVQSKAIEPPVQSAERSGRAARIVLTRPQEASNCSARVAKNARHRGSGQNQELSSMNLAAMILGGNRRRMSRSFPNCGPKPPGMHDRREPRTENRLPEKLNSRRNALKKSMLFRCGLVFLLLNKAVGCGLSCTRRLIVGLTHSDSQCSSDADSYFIKELGQAVLIFPVPQP